MHEQALTSSLAVLSLTLILGWYFIKQKRADDPFWQNISEQWPGRLAQFFYFVGIPYFAVSFGILKPRLLGLSGLDYFNLIDWSSEYLAVQIQQATTLMVLEWLIDSSMTLLAGSIALLVWSGIWLSLKYRGSNFSLARQSVTYIIYYGLHWAFYRAIFWSITDDLYLGVVLGSSFIILEWGLIQIWQKQWSTPQPSFLINTIILILTSTVFFYSPNLWLLWPIHWIMVALTNIGWRTETVSVP